MQTIRESLEINAPVSLCYQVLTQFDRYPRFMPHFTCVRPMEDGTWYWEMEGPRGQEVSWTIQVDVMMPDKVIVWHSLSPSSSGLSGSMNLQSLQGDRTKLDVAVAYETGVWARDILTEMAFHPAHRLREDLEKYKLLVEHMAMRSDEVQEQTGADPYAEIPMPRRS